VRTSLAQEQGLPAYVVAHDRTLRELARLKPRNPVELLQVPGFGPSKVERYAGAFLGVIREHAAG
jgi:ATP-dependent DNA helicase RecQ